MVELFVQLCYISNVIRIVNFDLTRNFLNLTLS